MLEGGDQPRGCGDAIEFLDEGLSLGRRKMWNHRNESSSGAILVGEHGIDDGGMVAEIFRGVDKQRSKRAFAFDGVDEGFRGNGKKSFLSASRNHFVGIVGQHDENLHTIDRWNMRASAAYGNLALAGSAAVAQFIENFRGESFHQEPA